MDVLTLKANKKMKKIISLGAIALAALVTAACNQELSVETQPGISEGNAVIHATREAAETKTTWHPDTPNALIWGADDKLSVFSTDNTDPNPNMYFYITADAYTAYWEGGWKSLAFTHGSAEIPGTAPYWGVYPYDRANEMVNGHLQIPFKVQQSAGVSGFDTDAFAAVAYSESSLNFNFKNLYGLLAIKVGEENVTSITLKSNKAGDAFSLTRTILGLAGQLYTVPTDGAQTAEVITLRPSSSDSFVVGQTYYMVVPPMSFAEGATFTLYNGEVIVAQRSTSGAVSVDQNKVHDVPAITAGEQPQPETANGLFDFPKLGYENAEEIITVVSEDVTLVAGKGDGSNAPKYYNTGSAGRFYGGNTITLTSEKNITKVEFTFGADDGENDILYGAGSVLAKDNPVWTGEAKNLVFTIGGTTGQRRIVTITVGTGSEQDPVVYKRVAAPTFNPAAGAVDSGTQVSLSCATEGASIYYSLTDAEPSTLYSAPISITETVMITAVAKKEGMIDSNIASASYTLKETIQYTDFSTIAELNAKVTDKSAVLNGHLTNAVVSFVPATNTAIIKDATGSITYYKSSHGLKQGQTFSGDLTVTALLYNGYSEVTAIDASFTGEEAVVEPETVALSALAGNFSTYQNAYVKVSGLTVTAVDGKYISVTDGTSNYQVYLNSTNSKNVAGQVITVVGIVTKYNSTEQIKVFKLDAITVDQDVAVPASIEATDITDVAAAGVTDATKMITIKNGDGWNATATPDMTVVTAASISNNVITYSVSANEGAARDGSITITLTKGGESDVVKVIKVSQLAAGTGPSAEAYSFTFNSNPFGEDYDGRDSNTPATKSAKLGEYTWSLTAVYIKVNNSPYLQLTTGSRTDNATFSCTDYDKDVKQIVLVVKTNSKKTVKVSASVNGVEYTCDKEQTVSSTSDVTLTFTVTSAQKGEILFNFTGATGGYYIKSFSIE